MTSRKIFKSPALELCIIAILLTACAGGSPPQPTIPETTTHSPESVATGLALRSLDLPQGIDKAGVQVNLEHAWIVEDRMVLEFTLRNPSWIDLDDSGPLSVQESAVLGDDLELSNFASREVFESEQDYKAGRIHWTLELAQPMNPEQMVKVRFGDIPVFQTWSEGQFVPLAVLEGPWEFEFRPAQAVNVPTRQLRLDQTRASDTFAITVEEILLSYESTLLTVRIDPGFEGAAWKMLGPVQIRVDNQTLPGQQLSNIDDVFTFQFPAIPADSQFFSLEFPPFQMSEPASLDLTLDLSIAGPGWQTLTVEGETLRFRVEDQPDGKSFVVRYVPANVVTQRELIAGPELSLSVSDDLGNSYTLVHQELRLSSHLALLEHRLSSKEALSEGAGELKIRSDRKGRITEPLRFPIRLVDSEGVR